MEPRVARPARAGPDRGGGRRTFVRSDEVPRLLRGALAGESTALRRILGARRAGRWGALLLALGALLAVPPGPAVPIVALWLAGGLALGRRWRTPAGPGLRGVLRLGQWTTAGCLALGAPLRLALGAGSVLPAAVAVVVGWVLLWRGLARGLGRADPAQSDADRGAAGGGPDSVEGTKGR